MHNTLRLMHNLCYNALDVVLCDQTTFPIMLGVGEFIWW